MKHPTAGSEPVVSKKRGITFFLCRPPVARQLHHYASAYTSAAPCRVVPVQICTCALLHMHAFPSSRWKLVLLSPQPIGRVSRLPELDCAVFGASTEKLTVRAERRGPNWTVVAS